MNALAKEYRRAPCPVLQFQLHTSGAQRRKKSGSASIRAQIAHRAPDWRLSAPSSGIRPVAVGLPKPGVNVDGGKRPLGALAAGVPPPAMELHAKRNATSEFAEPECCHHHDDGVVSDLLGSTGVVVAVPLKSQVAPVLAFLW
ncbi:hypothetical protein U9M48_015962 [Paspalum notatum var. saurae]|uniref:Uncharacterized protein n=1 Tax=Paspalum notatum var. saurae TaxID=547442 RepID=A0AAQ3T7N4_PASNO